MGWLKMSESFKFVAQGVREIFEEVYLEGAHCAPPPPLVGIGLTSITTHSPQQALRAIPTQHARYSVQCFQASRRSQFALKFALRLSNLVIVHTVSAVCACSVGEVSWIRALPHCGRCGLSSTNWNLDRACRVATLQNRTLSCCSCRHVGYPWKKSYLL